MEQVKILSKIYKNSLYLLVFLIPLWFLPITQDILSIQKQALLIVLVFMALIAWLAKGVSQQELNIRISWLHVPVLAVLLTIAISTVFSLWRYGSFWGWPLNVSDSFLTILFFALLYFLISNVIEEDKEIIKLFFVFALSLVISGIYTILQLYRVFIIPLPFAKVITFNTIGSVNSVAILLAILLPFTLTLAFALKTRFKWWFWVFTALSLVTILLINSFNAWLTLIAGMVTILFFGMLNLKKKIEFKWISLPMVLLIVALFFLVFRFSLPGAPTLPIEVSPSKGAEINMIFNSLKQNPAFGTGPATFVYDYAKYRQANLNQTIFWGARFASGASEVLDWFLTKGILGGLSLIALFVSAIFFLGRILIKSENDSLPRMIQVGILSSFVAVVTAQIIYYSNFTLSFLFWLLLAAMVVYIEKTPRKISLAPPSLLSVGFSFIFLLVLVFGVGLLFVGGQKYVAEVKYLNGARIVSKGDIEKGTAQILSAASLNPSLDLYWRDLSQLYLSRANQIAQDPNLPDEQKRQQSQVALSNAAISANRATTVNPANVQNWNVRGFVYRNLIGLEGADSFAIDSYSKAILLEPNSPFSFTELGRVYLIQAQTLSRQKAPAQKQEEALNKALENFNKALSLKTDYAPAHYLIASVYEQQGKSQEAILKLEETSQVARNDIGLAFQLGVIYYQRNQLNKAQSQFERIRALNPNYSNVRYLLGLIYDRQGQKSRAIEEFTKVSELNPDNNEVIKILENLKESKPALSGIQPSQPPVGENPPEIQGKENKK